MLVYHMKIQFVPAFKVVMKINEQAIRSGSIIKVFQVEKSWRTRINPRAVTFQFTKFLSL